MLIASKSQDNLGTDASSTLQEMGRLLGRDKKVVKTGRVWEQVLYWANLDGF